MSLLDTAGLTATAIRFAHVAVHAVRALEREGAWLAVASDEFDDDVHIIIMPCKSRNDNIYSEKLFHRFFHSPHENPSFFVSGGGPQPRPPVFLME